MKVCWTDAARADLRSIEVYIARHSRRYARSLVRRIINKSKRLARFPRLGPVVPEYNDDTLRELLEQPYRIIYRLLDKQVDVIAVIHAARRPPRSM